MKRLVWWLYLIIAVPFLVLGFLAYLLRSPWQFDTQANDMIGAWLRAWRYKPTWDEKHGGQW